MEINLTLLLQGCNFFIAYIILKKFLFRPAFDAIQHEEFIQGNLQADIMQCKAAVEQKKQEKYRRWGTCKSYFQQHAPSSVPYELFVFKYVSLGSIDSLLTDKEYQHLLHDVQQALIKKVEHV